MTEDGDVEMRRVDDAVALELHPDAVDAGPREREAELHLRAAVSDVGMRVDHVDEVVADGEHMAPGADILLQAVARRQMNANLRGQAGDGVFRARGELDLQVLGVL